MNQLRERLLAYGSETLLTEELLALVLQIADEKGCELTKRLLTKYGGLGEMLQIEYKELTQGHGLSETKASLLKAILELGKRLNRPQQDKYQIKTPADAARLVMPDMTFLDHEQLRVIVLNAKNLVVENLSLYQGTVNSSVLRAAEIYRPAILRNCPAIVICHNHPSGDPTPSDDDITATEQLVAAGQHLDIELVDHLVIGCHQFVSLRERLRW
jgi:DNA repair protein RadC